MARAYLRLDPAFFDRKAIDQKYPPAAVAALIGVLCHAEHQPKRGRFRDVRVLKALLGPLAKWIPFLIQHRDLVSKKGELYVEGWDEWQEGDWKVGERVKRIRNRQKGDDAGADVTVDVTPDVTVGVTVESESDDSVETVYNLSDGGRQSVIDSGGGGGKQVPESEPKTRATNGAGPTLSKSDLAAWSTFGHEWDAFRVAWIARGFRLPPSGRADDPAGQRALLYQVLDARPAQLPRWVAMASGKTSHEVVAWIIAQWHEVRVEAGIEDETPGTAADQSKSDAAESLSAILERMR